MALRMVHDRWSFMTVASHTTEYFMPLTVLYITRKTVSILRTVCLERFDLCVLGGLNTYQVTTACIVEFYFR